MLQLTPTSYKAVTQQEPRGEGLSVHPALGQTGAVPARRWQCAGAATSPQASHHGAGITAGRKAPLLQDNPLWVQVINGPAMG